MVCDVQWQLALRHWSTTVGSEHSNSHNVAESCVADMKPVCLNIASGQNVILFQNLQKTPLWCSEPKYQGRPSTGHDKTVESMWLDWKQFAPATIHNLLLVVTQNWEL